MTKEGQWCCGAKATMRRCLEIAVNNNEYYEPNPMEQIKTELTTMLLHAKNEGWIPPNELLSFFFVV